MTFIHCHDLSPHICTWLLWYQRLSGTLLLMPTCHGVLNYWAVVLEKNIFAWPINSITMDQYVGSEARMPASFKSCFSSSATMLPGQVSSLKTFSAVKWKALFLWRSHQLRCAMSFEQHLIRNFVTINYYYINYMILARLLKDFGLHFTYLQMRRRIPTSQGCCEA